MERVLSKSNKVIIEGKGVTAPVVLPPEVFQRKPQAPPEQAAPSDQGQAQPPASGSDQKKSAQ
jgi:membrane protease subunit HflK